MAVHTHLWSSGSVACTVPVIQSVYPRRRTRALQTFKCPYLQVALTVRYIIGPLNRRRRLLVLFFPVRSDAHKQADCLSRRNRLKLVLLPEGPSVCVQHRWHWTSAYIPPGGRLTNRAKSAAKFRRNWGYVGCTCSCTAPCRAFSAGSQRRRLKDI